VTTGPSNGAGSIDITEEQQDLQLLARKVAQDQIANPSRDWESSEEIDFRYLTKTLLDVGFLGMTIPTRYDGAGGSFMDFILILEQFAAVSNPAAFLLQATCSGPVSHIVELASEDIKAEVLPRIASGESMCALAITEADAGSDVGAMQTRLVDAGKDLSLSGTKFYVGGAGVADYYVVYARYGEALGTQGVACVLVSADTPGLRFGKQMRLLGTRGVPRRELIFDECKVPRENVMMWPGEFRNLMQIFNGERIHNSAMSLGTAQGAFDHARTYVSERVQFGKPLIDLQGVQWKLAGMATRLEAIRLMVYSSVKAHETGQDLALRSCMAKLFAAEEGFKVVDDALQLEGAFGCSDGIVEQAFRNIRTFRIAAGSTEMMLNFIGKQQTAQAR
jgi:alkylation response protein AidB-like acyl-CoA dehydrogenase